MVADGGLGQAERLVRWQTHASPSGCAWIRLSSRSRAGSAMTLRAAAGARRRRPKRAGESAAAGGDGRDVCTVNIDTHRCRVRRHDRSPSIESDAQQPEVLFVCVHNAGRSQMAAGLVSSLGGPGPRALGRQRARRDGSTPRSSRR